MLSPAIRFIALKGSKTPGGSIQLLCRVKPGVSASRQGVTAISDKAIELCVAARAKEGDANQAVREVIAEVLKVPKSDVGILKGKKRRDKTVMIGNINMNDTPEEHIARIRATLQANADFKSPRFPSCKSVAGLSSQAPEDKVSNAIKSLQLCEGLSSQASTAKSPPSGEDSRQKVVRKGYTQKNLRIMKRLSRNNTKKGKATKGTPRSQDT